MADGAVTAAWELDRSLMATARVLRRAYDAALAERLGISLNEAAVLGELAVLGSQTQVELARRVGLSRARIGVHIDALEQREAVQRAPDPADRRVWRVSLTRRGRSLEKQSVAVKQRVADGVHRGLDPTDLDWLARVLLAVQENAVPVIGDAADERGRRNVNG